MNLLRSWDKKGRRQGGFLRMDDFQLWVSCGTIFRRKAYAGVEPAPPPPVVQVGCSDEWDNHICLGRVEGTPFCFLLVWPRKGAFLMSQSITSRLNKWMSDDEHILVRCCKRCMSLLLALLGLTRDCIGPSVISILSLHWPLAPSLPNQWNPVQKCLAWGVCLLFVIGRCLKSVPCALCNCVIGLVWTQDIQCMIQVILVTNALKTIDIICTEHRQRRTKKILHISYISFYLEYVIYVLLLYI